MGDIVNFKEDGVDAILNIIDDSKESIKHLSVMITFKDDTVNLYHDEQKVSHLCLCEKILSMYIEELIG